MTKLLPLQSSNRRNLNLDLLRATAIVMVVLYHMLTRAPNVPPWIEQISKYGATGVDLFFVLSGWLIGGLLWKERIKYGDVQVCRFIGRRVLRTVPPYLICLVFYSFAVYFFKNVPFDFKFLVFLQNYELKIPYFLISWSLCVEEHFYIALPLIGLPLICFSKKFYNIFFLIFTLIPTIFRLSEIPVPENPPFGYFVTASHLRYDGLILGVWMAFLSSRSGISWKRVNSVAPFVAIVSFVTYLSIKNLDKTLDYAVGGLLIALFFTSVLVYFSQRPPFLVKGANFVYWTAVTSYSVYLTHAMVLDVVERTAMKAYLSFWLYAGCCLIFIPMAGALFYHLIEIPVLFGRNRLLPDRNPKIIPLK